MFEGKLLVKDEIVEGKGGGDSNEPPEGEESAAPCEFVGVEP